MYCEEFAVFAREGIDDTGVCFNVDGEGVSEGEHEVAFWYIGCVIK